MMDLDQTLLRNLIADMDLPHQRKSPVNIQDLHWLGRNMALKNSGHPQLDAARNELERLGARLVL